VARAKGTPDKQQLLRHWGTLNPHPQDLTHPLSQESDFFDPHDLVQVKYEMLRQVRVDRQPVSQTARKFGFSRPSFYQAQFTFEQGGLAPQAWPEKRPQAHRQNYAVRSRVANGAAGIEVRSTSGTGEAELRSAGPPSQYRAAAAAGKKTLMRVRSTPVPSHRVLPPRGDHLERAHNLEI
jgi:hypothetical protein